jgi:hypothetical protein
MIKNILFLLGMGVAGLQAQVLLYYTEDGKEFKFIKGYLFDSRMQITGAGRESWLVQAGYQFSPNGYIPGGQLRVGNPQFVPAGDGFLGFGGDERHFDRSIRFADIDYLLPETEYGKPLRVALVSGERGFLFVSSNYLQVFNESYKDAPPEDHRILLYLYRQMSGRKEDVQRSGFKVRAVAFTEIGLKHAQEHDFNQ